MPLQVLESQDKPDERLRYELLLALGEAQNRAGDRDGGKENCQRAADIARRTKAPDGWAGAALGLAGRGSEGGGADTEAMAVFEEALASLGSEDSALRAQ